MNNLSLEYNIEHGRYIRAKVDIKPFVCILKENSIIRSLNEDKNNINIIQLKMRIVLYNYITRDYIEKKNKHSIDDICNNFYKKYINNIDTTLNINSYNMLDLLQLYKQKYYSNSLIEVLDSIIQNSCFIDNDIHYLYFFSSMFLNDYNYNSIWLIKDNIMYIYSIKDIQKDEIIYIPYKQNNIIYNLNYEIDQILFNNTCDICKTDIYCNIHSKLIDQRKKNEQIIKLYNLHINTINKLFK